MRKIRHGVHPNEIPTNEYPTFSSRLRIAMEARKISVDELAESLYLTRSTIFGYLAGYRSPNLEILRLLSKKLDVSTDFLLGLRDDLIPLQIPK